MMKHLSASVAILILALAIPMVAAQTDLQSFRGVDLAKLLGVDAKLLEWPNLLYALILPFLGITAIFFGLLEEWGFFRRGPNAYKVNMLIAVFFSFLLVPSGALGIIANTLYAVGAMVTILIVGLFLFGTFILSAWHRGWGTVAAEKAAFEAEEGTYNRLKSVQQQITAEMGKQNPDSDRLMKLRQEETRLYGLLKKEKTAEYVS